MRKLLSEAPRPFGDLAAAAFPDTPRQEAQAGLGALVALGARVRDTAGTPVLSARYHLFARATEGAFTCLAPDGPHVALARREICPDCHGAVFEFGCCKRCGAVYLAGTIDRDADGERFTSRVVRGDRRSWLLLGEADQAADEDDETLEEGSVFGATRPTRCSALAAAGCMLYARGDDPPHGRATRPSVPAPAPCGCAPRACGRCGGCLPGPARPAAAWPAARAAPA